MENIDKQLPKEDKQSSVTIIKYLTHSVSIIMAHTTRNLLLVKLERHLCH